MSCSLNPSLGFPTLTEYGSQIGSVYGGGGRSMTDLLTLTQFNLTQFNLHMSGTMQKIIK